MAYKVFLIFLFVFLLLSMIYLSFFNNKSRLIEHHQKELNLIKENETDKNIKELEEYVLEMERLTK